MGLLREGLLDGRAVATAGVSEQVRRTLTGLGARVEDLATDGGLGEDEEQVGDWARAHAPLHALVYDAATAHSTDAVWVAIREVAVGALIPEPAPGKVVLIAPRPGPGEHARALGAALDNLARTLSVEWARFGVTVVALAPGEGATDEQLAQLICLLCSHAGDYFSGCRLELGNINR